MLSQNWSGSGGEYSAELLVLADPRGSLIFDRLINPNWCNQVTRESADPDFAGRTAAMAAAIAMTILTRGGMRSSSGFKGEDGENCEPQFHLELIALQLKNDI